MKTYILISTDPDNSRVVGAFSTAELATKVRKMVSYPCEIVDAEIDEIADHESGFMFYVSIGLDTGIPKHHRSHSYFLRHPKNPTVTRTETAICVGSPVSADEASTLAKAEYGKWKAKHGRTEVKSGP